MNMCRGGGQQRASSGAGRAGAALVVGLQSDRRACPGRRASHIVCPLVGLGRKGKGGSASTQRDQLPSRSTHRRKLLDGNSAQRVAPGTLPRSRDYPHTRTPTRCLCLCFRRYRRRLDGLANIPVAGERLRVATQLVTRPVAARQRGLSGVRGSSGLAGAAAATPSGSSRQL